MWGRWESEEWSGAGAVEGEEGREKVMGSAGGCPVKRFEKWQVKVKTLQSIAHPFFQKRHWPAHRENQENIKAHTLYHIILIDYSNTIHGASLFSYVMHRAS